MVLLSVVSLPFFTVLADTEPNENPVQANIINIGWENAEVDAVLSSSSDVDYYKFGACAGCTYVIETFNVQKTTSFGGTGLYLYDTDGTTLLSEDGWGLMVLEILMQGSLTLFLSAVHIT